MTTYTQATLAADTLRELGVVGAADAASGDDVTYVKRRLTGLLEWLAEKGKVDFDITGEIPAERYDALVQMLMPIVGPTYGVNVSPVLHGRGRAELYKGVRGDVPEEETVEDF